MKIQIYSDLHREHWRRRDYAGFPWAPSAEADVLVLAGDIDSGSSVVDWMLSEAERVDTPPHWVFVPGNHEFYGYVLEDRLAEMREQLAGSNVYLLDRDEVQIDGVRFLGTTLWTDYLASTRVPGIPDVTMAMLHAGASINDHNFIRVRRDGDGEQMPSRPFRPEDAAALHAIDRDWLQHALEQPFDGKTVVVTHHGPCEMAQHSHYPIDRLSGAFWSDVSGLFTGADLWIYGHTHSSIDTVVPPSGMRLVSNQGGYPSEIDTGFNPNLILEL